MQIPRVGSLNKTIAPMRAGESATFLRNPLPARANIPLNDGVSSLSLPLRPRCVTFGVTGYVPAGVAVSEIEYVVRAWTEVHRNQAESFG
jgi:hypothetical protein